MRKVWSSVRQVSPGSADLQRADALRGDDRDALRLTREAEELFIARRLVLAHGGEVLVLIADEEHLAEILLGVGFDLGERD